MIVIRIYEGLGNQMFEYAYAYALNKRRIYKNNVYIDTRDIIANKLDAKRIYRPITIDQFQLSLPKASSKILKKWEYIENSSIMQKATYQLSKWGLWKYKIMVESDYNYNKCYCKPNDNLYIMGWFQHSEYFNNVRSELLSEFTLKQKFVIPNNLQEYMKNYEVVSLHVRRGDYVSNRSARKVMYICKEEYYKAAVEYIQTYIRNVFLFIFTDDVEWVKRRLTFPFPSIVISKHYGFTDAQELILMSKCKHNIIANSTFSWWAAWLNTNQDKIVIAPKRWFVDKKRKNIAMKEWVTL